MGCRCCVDIQTFQSCVASEKIKQDVNETPLQKKKKTFFKSFFFCLSVSSPRLYSRSSRHSLQSVQEKLILFFHIRNRG